MSIVDASKVYDQVSVDPNFSLPPGVSDLGYTNPDDKTDSSLERSDETGEVISVDYDEWEIGENEATDEGESNNPGSGLLPPDWVQVITQVMRQTSDGRYVVDVILEVEDIPGVTGYEVGLTKT